ncbi:UBX domain-containing protein 6 [Aricia agestis]|uniref:UBX domain-containing protein 6 n=1 Tax=Aricia agestis TaxID=91739 RepID=UPI001C20AC10|nr:UBX domain-containing protein 6 [Aricia agestis]XP_041972455.1 UBX domain-containing protein 6 [Aricia agestis]
MADKIKKFFQKKKADAKFKLAGPGHKLSETTVRNQPSNSKQAPAPQRSGLSEESKLAADAALARLQQKREHPAFNTSLAAIKAQVKKELETEKAEPSSELSQVKERIERVQIESDLPKNLAVSGVFFRCPLISNDILSRDEWKKNIKTFLYEQLEEERGLTACLIIQSCNHNREKIDSCVETLCKYLENIITYPEEEKYKKIRMSNRVFTERVQPIEGSMELLQAAGFEQKKLPNADGVEEDFLVFNIDNVPSVESLTTLIDALRSAEPIQLELDRNLQVLLPSQAAAKMQLPPAFYALTPEEIKREQQLRTEALEKSQMLRTKAMREKDEIREMRKYKFAIIRVRFPDGILLQGTFSVYERYNEIHEFVQENLEHSGLPFVLNTPTGHKLIYDEDANKTLIDLRLVPATVLTFAWHHSVLDEINNSPNKDVYLKPEVMVLVQEI